MGYFKYYWKKSVDDSVEIMRVFGETSFVWIPATLAGKKVAKIGNCCFGTSPFQKGEDVLEAVLFYDEDGKEKEVSLESIPDEKMQSLRELAGEAVEQVVIQAKGIALGRLAFYNCRQLSRIAFFDGVETLDGDAFMNCDRLYYFVFQVSPVECKGLQQILHQCTWDTECQFLQDGQMVAKVFYPEYSESYHEIGPAHIFELLVEGEGFRARQCFQNATLDLDALDHVFEKACVEEESRKLCRMAADRLRYPYALSEQASKNYLDYLSQNRDDFANYLCNEGELEDFSFFIEQGCLQIEQIENSIAILASKELVEKTAGLIALKDQYFAQEKEEYGFDEW